LARVKFKERESRVAREELRGGVGEFDLRLAGFLCMWPCLTYDQLTIVIKSLPFIADFLDLWQSEFQIGFDTLVSLLL
jgi:hypothetical protein